MGYTRIHGSPSAKKVQNFHTIAKGESKFLSPERRIPQNFKFYLMFSPSKINYSNSTLHTHPLQKIKSN